MPRTLTIAWILLLVFGRLNNHRLLINNLLLAWFSVLFVGNICAVIIKRIGWSSNCLATTNKLFRNWRFQWPNITCFTEKSFRYIQPNLRTQKIQIISSFIFRCTTRSIVRLFSRKSTISGSCPVKFGRNGQSITETTR